MKKSKVELLLHKTCQKCKKSKQSTRPRELRTSLYQGRCGDSFCYASCERHRLRRMRREDRRVEMNDEERKPRGMPNPTSTMVEGDPLFDAIYDVIKSWDVNVPEYYQGYCHCNGSHATLIYRAVQKVLKDEMKKDV